MLFYTQKRRSTKAIKIKDVLIKLYYRKSLEKSEFFVFKYLLIVDEITISSHKLYCISIDSQMQFVIEFLTYFLSQKFHICKVPSIELLILILYNKESDDEMLSRKAVVV